VHRAPPVRRGRHVLFAACSTRQCPSWCRPPPLSRCRVFPYRELHLSIHELALFSRYLFFSSPSDELHAFGYARRILRAGLLRDLFFPVKCNPAVFSTRRASSSFGSDVRQDLASPPSVRIRSFFLFKGGSSGPEKLFLPSSRDTKPSPTSFWSNQGAAFRFFDLEKEKKFPEPPTEVLPIFRRRPHRALFRRPEARSFFPKARVGQLFFLALETSSLLPLVSPEMLFSLCPVLV